MSRSTAVACAVLLAAGGCGARSAVAKRVPVVTAASRPPVTNAPVTTAATMTTSTVKVTTTLARAVATAPTSAAPTTPTAKAPTCAGNLAAELASTGSASQLVTVDAPAASATSATLTTWQRSGSCWVMVAGPWDAHVGYGGMSDHHMEGDGTTPSGAYGIGPMMYGNGPNPGVHYGYHALVCGDWWDEDPSSSHYNTFQHVTCGAQPPFGGSSEALWTETTAYQDFAVISYNAGPVVPGRGSAVFLHVDKGGPTNGCVSLPADALTTVLRWLQPSAAPLIVLGTDAGIRRW